MLRYIDDRSPRSRRLPGEPVPDELCGGARGILISLLRGLFAAAPGRVAAALALTAAVGLTEGITLLLLLPLFQLAGVAGEGSLGSPTTRLASVFNSVNVTPTLASVLIVYVVLTILQATLVRARSLADTIAVQIIALWNNIISLTNHRRYD